MVVFIVGVVGTKFKERGKLPLSCYIKYERNVLTTTKSSCKTAINFKLKCSDEKHDQGQFNINVLSEKRDSCVINTVILGSLTSFLLTLFLLSRNCGIYEIILRKVPMFCFQTRILALNVFESIAGNQVYTTPIRGCSQIFFQATFHH